MPRRVSDTSIDRLLLRARPPLSNDLRRRLCRTAVRATESRRGPQVFAGRADTFDPIPTSRAKDCHRIAPVRRGAPPETDGDLTLVLSACAPGWHSRPQKL